MAPRFTPSSAPPTPACIRSRPTDAARCGAPKAESVGFVVRRRLPVLLLGDLLQLRPPIERINKRPRLAPARLDDHMQFEKNPRAQQRFDLLACAGADLFQLRSALADQNRL